MNFCPVALLRGFVTHATQIHQNFYNASSQPSVSWEMTVVSNDCFVVGEVMMWIIHFRQNKWIFILSDWNEQHFENTKHVRCDIDNDK